MRAALLFPRRRCSRPRLSCHEGNAILRHPQPVAKRMLSVVARHSGRVMGSPVTWFAVAAGGALGSLARFWLAAAVAAWTGPRFPWGTLLINVLGSFIIG